MPKYPKTPKGWNSSDVHWTIPGKKKPIAYSTVATSDLIVLLSKEHKTIIEVQAAINFDQEAINVLQKYIDAGYGEQVAQDFFK